MEARVSVLEEKVESLERRSDEHEKEDERLHRYMTHMMEDLNAKLSSLEKTGIRFEADLAHRSTKENGTERALEEIFNRVRTIERTIWLAIGSTTAFGAMFAYFGHNLAVLLSK